jgi:hypothetical protein
MYSSRDKALRVTYNELTDEEMSCWLRREQLIQSFVDK